MPEMRFAAIAVHLGAPHEERPVFGLADHLGVERLVERRPAGAAFEFRVLVEKRRAAADAAIGAGVLGKILMGSGTLGAMLAGDLVGERGKLLFPLRIGFVHLFHSLLHVAQATHVVTNSR